MQAGCASCSILDKCISCGAVFSDIGIEQAAKAAGIDVTVPFAAGRGDTTPAMTDIESFGVLEPLADGFRNWLKKDYVVSAEELLLERAHAVLRAYAEVYAQDDNQAKFVHDFVAAWCKVMNADRFDLD